MNIPKSFDINEISFANNSVMKLYDSLSVIRYSLELIKHQGRHEFEPVIALQLRLICIKNNQIYDKDTFKKRGLTDSENNFCLFDIIANYIGSFDSQPEERSKIEETTIFPEIQFSSRDYNDRNHEFPYYFYTDNSVVEHNKYTFNDFLNQPYFKVEYANGQRKYKSVEQCIKILANKAQGAHYQHALKKFQGEVIQSKGVITQTLGEIMIGVLSPICLDILKLERFEDYDDRSIYKNFNIMSHTPMLEK